MSLGKGYNYVANVTGSAYCCTRLQWFLFLSLCKKIEIRSASAIALQFYTGLIINCYDPHTCFCLVAVLQQILKYHHVNDIAVLRFIVVVVVTVVVSCASHRRVPCIFMCGLKRVIYWPYLHSNFNPEFYMTKQVNRLTYHSTRVYHETLHFPQTQLTFVSAGKRKQKLTTQPQVIQH